MQNATKRHLVATELERLTAYITRHAILTPGSAEHVIAAGINPRDWPTYQSKVIFEKFLEDHQKNGYEYAAWQASKNGLPQLQEIYGAFQYPADTNTIKSEYLRLLDLEQAERLGVMISAQPLRAKELIAEYLGKKSSSVEIVTFAESVMGLAEDQRKMRQEGKLRVDIPNWPILSQAIGGFNPGRLGILIADTGFGKTNFGIQMALDASMKIPTLYFNMEMVKNDFTQRLVANVLKMGPKDFHQEWDCGRAELFAKQRELFYSTGKDLSLLEIESVCRSYKSKHKIEIIMVDYDQKLQLSQAREEWKELQQASVALESLAKELNCYVLLFAQSNLEGQISGSKRSTFPASNVFIFEKHEDSSIVRATKNRFGVRNATIRVDYNPALASVVEKEPYVWTPPSKGLKK